VIITGSYPNKLRMEDKKNMLNKDGNSPKIKKVVLMQPNYSWFGKRSWRIYPYALGILNACIKNSFKTELIDPNLENLNDQEVIDSIRESNPDAICISSASTEYIKLIEHTINLIKTALPKVVVIAGGVVSSVALKAFTKIRGIDYWMMGEGEYALPKLLEELNKPQPNLSNLNGLAYYENGELKINKQGDYISNLDLIPFADYGNLSFNDYGYEKIKYAQGSLTRKFPYAVTITSRGCPYNCIFCSGWRVSGKKVRMRSAENVLKEIDLFYKNGIKEVIFLDDHFLFSRQRAMDIMKGLIKRKYNDFVWKCANLTVFLLDQELIDLMKESGCYQMTVSIESGNQDVLTKIIKKPINLEKIPNILKMVKECGIEIIANFIIGFPGETWDQIRDTFSYAEMLDIDLVNFHIATPLPNTELMEICIKEGYLPKNANEDECSGYTKGIISSDEFTPQELQILRAFEWDRINFITKERKEIIARIQGISLVELEKWRKDTRRQLGVNVLGNKS